VGLQSGNALSMSDSGNILRKATTQSKLIELSGSCQHIIAHKNEKSANGVK
jgi:hypothetical protein